VSFNYEIGEISLKGKKFSWAFPVINPALRTWKNGEDYEKSHNRLA
jgi:hypothetical protein